MEQSPYLAQGLRGWFPKARLIERNRSSEYWVRDDAEVIQLEGPLGHFNIAVQPNLSHRYAGRRGLNTQSRNNNIAWILDWIRYYVAVHGADAVLIHDNNSTDYTCEELHQAIAPEASRHGDFWLRDRTETDECPPKWCVVPAKTSRKKHCWSEHNVFGSRANRHISQEFEYAHVRGISTGWKEKRWDAVPYTTDRFVMDERLRANLAKASILRG